jgi:uncharacterized protein YozE (UPF0346 family)
MSEPLFSPHLYQALHEVIGKLNARESFSFEIFNLSIETDVDDQTLQDRLRVCLNYMDIPSYKMASLLFSHLHRYMFFLPHSTPLTRSRRIAQTPMNQMNPSNLAIVFAPNLFTSSTDFSLMAHQQNIVRHLIMGYPHIFALSSIDTAVRSVNESFLRNVSRSKPISFYHVNWFINHIVIKSSRKIMSEYSETETSDNLDPCPTPEKQVATPISVTSPHPAASQSPLPLNSPPTNEKSSPLMKKGPEITIHTKDEMGYHMTRETNEAERDPQELHRKSVESAPSSPKNEKKMEKRLSGSEHLSMAFSAGVEKYHVLSSPRSPKHVDHMTRIASLKFDDNLLQNLTTMFNESETTFYSEMTQAAYSLRPVEPVDMSATRRRSVTYLLEDAMDGPPEVKDASGGIDSKRSSKSSHRRSRSSIHISTPAVHLIKSLEKSEEMGMMDKSIENVR